jgi:hypothetical protein
MNEIQIIQQQLVTERLHFAEVARACADALDKETWAQETEFAHACADYFAFAVSRFDAGSTAAAKLQARGAPNPVSTDAFWQDFLQLFNADRQQHFARLDARLTRSTPVTQWRVLSGIDADSIFTERALYERVKATLPSGIAPAALSAFLP